MATASISREESAALHREYYRAGDEAGCPPGQMANFARARIALQPRQLLASAAARECDRPDGPTKILYGGARGGGKSHWMLSQVGADDCQRYPGLKCLLLRKVGKANKENFEDLRQRLFMGLKHQYNRQEGVLTFDNGSRIIAGHFQNESDIDAYLGLEYDLIATEEAGTLAPRKQRDISTCCRTSKDGWRPREYKSTNPGGVGHAHLFEEFIKPFRRQAQTETRFIPATCRDNAFLNPEYMQTLEGLTGWQRRAWLDGDWDIAAGQFFTTFRESVHVVPSFPIPKGWQVWGGFDYGFTHYTAFYLLTISGDGDIYIVDEYLERGRVPQQNAPAIIDLLRRHNLSPAHLRPGIVAGADVFAQKGEGRTIADTYKSLGIRLIPATMDRINGAGEILRRLGNPEEGIPPKMFVMSRCTRLAECLPMLQHDPHRPEDVLKWDTDEDGIGGDDPYDAVRYGVMAVLPPKLAPTSARPPAPTPGNPFARPVRR